MEVHAAGYGSRQTLVPCVSHSDKAIARVVRDVANAPAELGNVEQVILIAASSGLSNRADHGHECDPLVKVTVGLSIVVNVQHLPAQRSP